MQKSKRFWHAVIKTALYRIAPKRPSYVQSYIINCLSLLIENIFGFSCMLCCLPDASVLL